MRNYFSLLFVTGLVGLIGCKSEPVTTDQTPVLTPPIATSVTITGEAGGYQVADSINAYRPTFGSANTVLQYPFGLVNKPTSPVRLIAVKYDSVLASRYQYDEQNRLSQRTDYYNDNIHMLRRNTYHYNAQGVTKITSEISKYYQGYSTEGYPLTDDLIPSITTTYIPYMATQAWLEQRSSSESPPNDNTLGSAHLWLGFNAKGALVWEEKVNYPGISTEYALYRRNPAGNIVFYRGASEYHSSWNYTLTYDDKPNPFYTTGDTQSNSPVDFSLSSPNNILSRQGQSSGETYRYEHAYRPDGYPYQTKIYLNGKLEKTLDYTYNQ